MIILDNQTPSSCCFGICVELMQDGSKQKRRYFKTVDNYLVIFGFGKIKNWKQPFTLAELRGKLASYDDGIWTINAD